MGNRRARAGSIHRNSYRREVTKPHLIRKCARRAVGILTRAHDAAHRESLHLPSWANCDSFAAARPDTARHRFPGLFRRGKIVGAVLFLVNDLADQSRTGTGTGSCARAEACTGADDAV